MNSDKQPPGSETSSNGNSNVAARLKETCGANLVGIGLTLVLSLLAWILPFPGAWLANLSYDLPFAFQNTKTIDEAVIVYIDQESYEGLDQDYLSLWDRNLHTELVEKLTSFGAQGMVFDILFASDWDAPSVDQEFGKAIAQSSNVVLAASHQYAITESEQVGLSALIRAVPSIGTNAPWGVIDLPLGTDGVIREHYTHERYTNLAWAAANRINQLPEERVKRRWIRYYGQPLPVATYSYLSILRDEALASRIKGRVVYVGHSSLNLPRQGKDEVKTPYTRWTGEKSTGVEVQATAFLNLIRNDWLSRMPVVIELIILFCSAIFLTLGLSTLRPVKAIAGALVTIVVVFGLALTLVASANVWTPWAIVAMVQVPIALGWSTIRNASINVRSEKVPDHQLLRVIGQGAYGEVWLARNIVGVHHAVKLVYRDRFNDDKPYEREFDGIKNFMPISRSIPGCVQIHHVGRNDAERFFFSIMELGDDAAMDKPFAPNTYSTKTLASELKQQGIIPVERCVELGVDLANALGYLHKKGLIHRDIKPSNVIFVEGSPRFADIGLVTQIKKNDEASTYLGTQGYIAPEGPGSKQADIFSLGKVLYQISTGQEPHLFPEAATSLMDADENSHFLELFEIVAKACAHETTRRYETAEELKDDLEKLLRTIS